MGPVAPDNHVKFGDLGLNLSEKFHPKPSEAAFSTVFFRFSFRLELISHVISGVNVGINVPVKCADSISNGSRAAKPSDAPFSTVF